MVIGSTCIYPIKVEEVATLLGTAVANCKVQTIAVSAAVNKWSKWKPMAIAGKDSPSCPQVIAAHMGISYSGASVGTLKNACQSASNTQPTLSQMQSAMTSATGFTYTKPTRDYRLSDFAKVNENASNNPYYFRKEYDHSAKAPDTCDDWTVAVANVQSVANASLTSSQYSQSNYDWSITGTDKLVSYGAMSLRYGAESQESVNASPVNAMPLNWILGDAAAGEKWRIGMAVLLPWTGAGVNTPHWVLFVGRMLFTKANTQANVGNVLPDLITNITAARELLYNANTKNVRDYTAIPVLVKDTRLGLTAVASGYYITYVDLTNATMYHMPSKSIVQLHVVLPEVMHKENGKDSTYRWMMWTPLSANASTRFHVRMRRVVTSGSGTSVEDKYYILSPQGACTATIAHDESKHNATGNMYVSNISGPTVQVIVREYDTKDDYDYGKASAIGGIATTKLWNACVLPYFTVYCGAAVPDSITITIDAQTKAFN